MKIEIGSAYSRIRDLDDPDIIDDIKYKLSVRPDNYYFDPLYKSHKWDGYVHFLDKRGNRFPTGLLKDVVSVIKGKVPFELIDKRKVNWYDIQNFPKELHFDDIELRDYQYDSVKQSLIKHSGILNLTTNAGKTVIATAIIRELLKSVPDDQTIIFFTHNKEIFNQIVDNLNKRLKINIGEVGSGTWKPEKVTVAMLPTIARHLKKPTANDVDFMGQYKVLRKIKKKIKPSISHSNLMKVTELLQNSRNKVDQQMADILVDIITNHKDLKKELRSMNKILKKYIDKKLEKKMGKYNQAKEFLDSAYCTVTDECQHTSAKSFYDVLMACPAPYRFGLSGTIDEDNKVNYMRQRACIGPIIYRISNEFMIEHGYSAKPTVYLETINKPLIDSDVSWQDAYKYGIEENEYRNSKIVKRALQKYTAKKSCLIIVNHIAHGQTLLNAFDHLGVHSEFTNGSLSDDIRENIIKELKDGSLKILIATNILDEGVDISGINCVFMASGGKSYRQVIQRVGRGLRIGKNKKTVEIYDYLDYTHPILVKHTAERFDYYKNEKFTIRHAR